MSQTKGPKPQIGSGVGDTAQAVLNGVDGLMHCQIPEVELWDRDTASNHSRTSGHNNVCTTGPEVHSVCT